MNILQYKGTEIEVTFGEEIHKFEFLKNGIKERYIVTAPSVADMAKQITLNWLIEKLDNLGNVIAPAVAGKKLFDDGLTYIKWYNYEYTGKGGQFWFAPSFNGILATIFGDDNLYCFNPLDNFSFFQPLIFEVLATENSATATILNGSGTIVYSLNETDWQESNIFEGLEPNTEYTIFAKTIEDGWASKVKFNTLPNE
jgi:hypothetical protein